MEKVENYILLFQASSFHFSVARGKKFSFLIFDFFFCDFSWLFWKSKSKFINAPWSGIYGAQKESVKLHFTFLIFLFFWRRQGSKKDFQAIDTNFSSFIVFWNVRLRCFKFFLPVLIKNTPSNFILYLDFVIYYQRNLVSPSFFFRFIF